jgi:hypothetical protein
MTICLIQFSLLLNGVAIAQKKNRVAILVKNMTNLSTLLVKNEHHKCMSSIIVSEISCGFRRIYT